MTTGEQFGERLASYNLMNKAWAEKLFASDVATANNLVADEIDRALNDKLAPIDIFRLSEVARVVVMGVHNRWMREYATNISAFTEDVMLWHLLWKMYAVNLRAIHESDPELTKQKAALLQRALFIGKELRLIHAIAKKPFPASLWKEIYAYYRFAEAKECLYDNISDKLLSSENRVNSFVMAMCPILLDLAQPDKLSATQIVWTNRWLLRLARKVTPVYAKDARDGLFLSFDLTQSAGATLVTSAVPTHDLMRFASIAEVARSMSRRRRHLIAGETPERLRLGDDIDKDHALELIIHLESAWCRMPDAPKDARDNFLWDAVD